MQIKRHAPCGVPAYWENDERFHACLRGASFPARLVVRLYMMECTWKLNQMQIRLRSLMLSTAFQEHPHQLEPSQIDKRSC